MRAPELSLKKKKIHKHVQIKQIKKGFFCLFYQKGGYSSCFQDLWGGEKKGTVAKAGGSDPW